MSRPETLEPQDLSSAAGALAHLVGAAGIACHRGDLERSLASVWPTQQDRGFDSTEWLALAGEGQGLRVERVEASLPQALERVDRGRPLAHATRDESGRMRFTVLLGRRRGEVHLACFGGVGPEGERRVASAEVGPLLGLGEGESAHWILADPATPCADAVSPPGGPPLSQLTRLGRLLRPDRGDILTVAAFAVATGVLLLATPIAVQALVNFVALGGAVQQLVVVALLLFLGLAFAGVLSGLQSWIVELLQRRIFVRLVADLGARLPRVSQGAYDHGYGPELVNRFFDVITIQKVGSHLLIDGLSVLLSVLVGLVVLAFYHPILLAFDVVLLAVIAVLVLAPARRGMATAVEESTAKYAVVAWMEELARNPFAFKSAGARRWVFEHTDRLASMYVRGRARHYRLVFRQIVGALTLQVVASTALLAIGGFLVIGGTLTLGQLVAAELIVTTVVGAVAKMGKHLESFYDLTASVHKLGKLLDLPVERLGGEHHLAPETAPGARLSLSGVTWLLPSGAPLFEGLSLELPAGGSACVTGPSGAGKSTLVEIIWGLRRPSSGRVELDGRDVRDLSLDSLRHEIALASRVEIVEGSLRENVSLGRAFVSDEDVREALRAVGLIERIGALPEGMDTPMRAAGHPLSEGEVRLLMIARAIAGKPRLLVVEDLLDVVSAERRKVVLEALFDPGARWTLLLVSNRTDARQRSEQVLAMPGGEVSRRAASPSQVSA